MEFANVAGVIADDEFIGWVLFENPSYLEYSELKRTRLFDAIRALK